MANISDNNIILRLILKSKEFRNSIGKSKKDVNGLNNSIDTLQKRVGKAVAAKLTFDLIKQLQKTSIEMEQLDKKANIVFGETLPAITKAAKENAFELGLTTNEYIKSAAAIQDLLIPMKFTREEASSISVELVNLSGALSEWSGGQRSAAEVSEILNKALLGEREQLKTLGISIQEADVKNRLLEKGQTKLTGTLLQQAKAQATLELITEKSTDAQDSYANSADSAARKSAKLGAAFRQVGEDMGRVFQGIFASVGDLFSPERIVKAVRMTVAQIGSFFVGLGQIMKNGVAQVTRGALEIEQIYLRVQKAGEDVFGSEESSARLQKQIDDVQKKQDELVANTKGFGEAFRDSYFSIMDNFELKAQEKAAQVSKAAAGQLEKQLTKEQKKALEKYEKDLKKAQKILIDLQNELIADDEQRQVEQARTAAERTIAGLVGSEKQIEEQAKLIRELLKREEKKIRESFQPFTAEDVETQLFEESIIKEEAEKLLEKMQVEIDKQEPLKLNIQTTSPEQLKKDTESINSAIDSAAPGFGEKVGKLFDPESENNKKLREGLSALQDITGSIFAADDKATEARLNNIDAQVKAADERIKRAVEGGKEGSEEVIAIEEAKIERLEKARQRSLEQQQKQAKIESALAATSSLVNAVPLVIDLFKKGGLVGGLAGIASVIASIATLRAAVQKNTPTFHDGTSYADETGTATGGKLKSNEFMAKLEKGEMVIPKGDSARLRHLGVKHTDILKLAESTRDKGVVTLGGNLDDSQQIIDAIVTQNDKLLRYIKNLKTEVRIDERGLSIRQMKLQSKIKKRR
jgi:hypothetical protein